MFRLKKNNVHKLNLNKSPICIYNKLEGIVILINLVLVSILKTVYLKKKLEELLVQEKLKKINFELQNKVFANLG